MVKNGRADEKVVERKVDARIFTFFLSKKKVEISAFYKSGESKRPSVFLLREKLRGEAHETSRERVCGFVAQAGTTPRPEPRGRDSETRCGGRTKTVIRK